MSPRERLEALARIGWLPDTDAPAPLALIHGDRPIFRNPFASLRDDPQLWLVWDRWRLGLDRQPASEDYDELSAWHLEAVQVLRASSPAAEAPRG